MLVIRLGDEEELADAFDPQHGTAANVTTIFYSKMIHGHNSTQTIVTHHGHNTTQTIITHHGYNTTQTLHIMATAQHKQSLHIMATT